MRRTKRRRCAWPASLYDVTTDSPAHGVPVNVSASTILTNRAYIEHVAGEAATPRASSAAAVVCLVSAGSTCKELAQS